MNNLPGVNLFSTTQVCCWQVSSPCQLAVYIFPCLFTPESVVISKHKVVKNNFERAQWWSLFCNFLNLHFSPSYCVPLCQKTYLTKYKFNWTILRGSSIGLKFRIFLISSGQIRFFIACHFNGKYILTIIQCLQHCFSLQILHLTLLLNNF